MKSKKMTKSTFAIIIMGIVMVAMLAFGGTFALFTAQASTKTSAEFTTGTIKLTSGVTFASETDANILPGSKITTAAITVKPEAVGTKSFVAVKLTITGTGSVDDLNLNNVLADGWVALTGENKGIYVYATGTNDTDYAFAEMNAETNFTKDAILYDATSNSLDDQAGAKMGLTYKIEVRAASVQSTYGDTALSKEQAIAALVEKLAGTPAKV